MDSVAHGSRHHSTKIHRKEDGKVTEKETAREPRGVASPKEERWKPRERKRSRKERTTSQTKSQNLQKSSVQGNIGQINLGLLKETLRVGGEMIDTQQIRILRCQRMLLSVNCEIFSV